MLPVTLDPTPRPHALTADAQDRLLAGAPWRRLLVMGDSIAEGIGDPTPGFTDRPWGDQLALALERVNPGLLYRNLGERGLKAGQILESQAPRGRAFAPDLVVVSAGGNDVLGRRFDPGAVRACLEDIVEPLAAQGALVVTFSLFDLAATPFVPDEMKAGLRARLEVLAELTEMVALSTGGLHVDFLSDPATGDPAMYSDDQLHANRRGHALVLAGFVQALGSRLGNQGGPIAGSTSAEVSGAPPGP